MHNMSRVKRQLMAVGGESSPQLRRSRVAAPTFLALAHAGVCPFLVCGAHPPTNPKQMMSASAVRTQRASSQMVRDEQHAGVCGVEEDERTGVSPLEWPLAKCAVAGVVQSFNREKKCSLTLVMTCPSSDAPPAVWAAGSTSV